MSDVLESILKTMEFYQKTYPDDTTLAVFDTDKLIGQVQGIKMNSSHSPGMSIKENFKNTVTEKAIKTGRRLQEERDASLIGFPYVSTAVPIMENGIVVGCLSVLTSTERYDVLQNSATELSMTVEEMSATTDEVTYSSNDVAERLQALSEESMKMLTDIEGVHSILTFIQDIATHSHMLGLNAAIEAARAGEAGRGFSIVAKEIQKMGDDSKKAVSKIKEQLEQIQNRLERINGSVQQISGNTKEHAISMENLNADFEQILVTAEKLANSSSRE